jgi:hypothetical protein
MFKRECFFDFTGGEKYYSMFIGPFFIFFIWLLAEDELALKLGKLTLFFSNILDEFKDLLR